MINAGLINDHIRYANTSERALSTSTNFIPVAQSADKVRPLRASVQPLNMSMCPPVQSLHVFTRRSRDVPLTPKQREIIDAAFPVSLTPQENNAITTCIRYLLPQHEQEGDLVTQLLFLLHRAAQQDGHHDNITNTIKHFMEFYTSMQMQILSIDYTHKLAIQQPNNAITTLMEICANILKCEDHAAIFTEFCSLITSDMSNTELHAIEYNFTCINMHRRHAIYYTAKRLLAEYPRWRVTNVLSLLNLIEHHLEQDDILKQTLYLVRNIQDQGEIAVTVGNCLRFVAPKSDRQQFVNLIEQLSQRNPQWDLGRIVFAASQIHSKQLTAYSDHAERENIMGYLELLSTKISSDLNELFSSSVRHMLSDIDLDERSEIVQHVVSILPSLVTGDELVQIMSAISRLMSHPRFAIAWNCLQRHLTAEFEMQHRILILHQLVPILQHATSDTDVSTRADDCIYKVRDELQTTCVFK